MKKEKPKFTTKKYKKIGITTLIGLPIIVGAGLSTLAIFSNQDTNPISPESRSVEGADTATFTFDFKDQPDNGTDVEIYDISGKQIDFFDQKNKSKHFDVVDRKLSISFAQTDIQPQAGNTTFSLKFNYEVAKQPIDTSITKLEINWNPPKHTLELSSSTLPQEIVWQSGQTGQTENVSFTVLFDGEDVTSRVTFENTLNPNVVVESNKLSWNDKLGVGQHECKITAKYDGWTSNSLSTIFKMYGASVDGGTTEIKNTSAVVGGKDTKPWKLTLSDTNIGNVEPENVEYTIINLSPSVDFIKVDNEGFVSWIPEDTTKVPSAGTYTFNVQATGTYGGATFSATSNQITLVIPTVTFECNITNIDGVLNTKGKFDLKNEVKPKFLLGEDDWSDKINFALVGPEREDVKVSTAGVISWPNLSEQLTIQIKAYIGEGVFFANTNNITITPHTFAVVGEVSELDWGNEKDNTHTWQLMQDGTTSIPLTSDMLDVVDETGETKLSEFYFDENCHLCWNKEALTSASTISIKVRVTVSSGWYAGKYLSNPISFTRQAEPTLSGPTEANITVGTPGSTTQAFELINLSEKVTAATEITIDPTTKIDGISLDDENHLHWDGTITKAQDKKVLTIIGTKGFYSKSSNITLNVTDAPHISEEDGKTEFTGPGGMQTPFGKFNFYVEGQICDNADWTIDEGHKDLFEMFHNQMGGDYWTVRTKTNLYNSINTIVITADDKNGHTATLDVTINTFNFVVDPITIWRDNSTDAEFQCSATVTDPDGTEHKITSEATWDLKKDGGGLPAGIEINADTGVITIVKNSVIHEDDTNLRCYAEYSYEGHDLETSNNCDIHFDAATLAGGATQIELDEDGKFSDENPWRLKIGSDFIVQDVSYAVVEASSQDLKDSISFNSGKVVINGGVAGSFKVQATSPHEGLVMVSEVINVTEPIVNYEIANIPDVLYATKGYSGGLIDHPYVTKNGTKLDLSVNVVWSKIDGPDGVTIRTEGGGVYTNMCHMTWSTNDLEPGNYNVKLQAVVDGVSAPIQKTVVLNVVGPQGIMKINESDTTWTVTQGSESDHEIGFEFDPGVEKEYIQFQKIDFDESLKSLGFTIKNTDMERGVIVTHHNGRSISSLGESGYITLTFHYLGSYVSYRFNVNITY